MKSHLLLTTIAAVLLVGCGPSVDIHQAAKDGNIEAVKQHIAIGTDVNVMNNAGGTPLHMAVFWGRSEIAELLIDAGADVNVNGDTGFTPLDVITHPGFPSRSPAPKAARKEIADLLRKLGGKTGVELEAEGK